VIARIRSLLAGAGGLALLPLSAVPLLLIGPSLIASHGRFQRTYNSPPYPAAEVRLPPAQLARYTPVAPFRGAVPVLAYHGIDDANDGYSVSREEFARQMTMLERSGYRTISIAQYLRFRSGNPAGLPPRPILITFDDGRLDSYRGADAVLAEHHMHAVMYVITAPVSAGNAFHLSWRELHRMQASGRWDVQPHAHDGHRMIVADPAGDTAPYYAAPRYTRSDGMETFAAYTQRVATDIYALKDEFRAQGFDAQTFAVPFGDHGQNASDPRVQPFLDQLLATQFQVSFVQAARNDPRYTRPTGVAARYELHTATTTDALHEWLVRHDPAEHGA
jgi:biofilm PGA synthesis lipoprotein PgaB